MDISDVFSLPPLLPSQEKKEQIVQEITFLKNLKSCSHILQYLTAANLQQGKGLSATR